MSKKFNPWPIIGVTFASLFVIALEYHLGYVRRGGRMFFGWLFAWVWDVHPSSLLIAPSTLWAVLWYGLIALICIAAYVVLGSLATGVTVGIARRLHLNPAEDTQTTFLIFWPVVLATMLALGFFRVIVALLTPVCRLFYHQGIKGVDKPFEVVTGQELIIRPKDGESYIDQPVSLFDEPK